MRGTVRTVVALAAAVWLSAAAAVAAPLLWIADQRFGAGLLHVDPASGERTFVDLDDYPVVIGLGAGVQAPTGEVFLEAVNAAMSSTVVRWDPDSGEVSGISGYVDRDSDVPRGAGPDFRPGVASMAIGPWGALYALRQHGGPMLVDIATGDRRVVSQSADPAVGAGVELTEPLDLVVQHSGRLLVADRWAGLVRIDPSSGDRRVAFTFPDLVEGPHRIERLPDGRVAHAFGAGDGSEIVSFDRPLRFASQLSGPLRGSGPAFVAIVDMVVAPDGLLYVLDAGLRAILAVDPATGDRRVVAEDTAGVDLGYASPNARFVSFEVPLTWPAPRPVLEHIEGPLYSGMSGSTR